MHNNLLGRDFDRWHVVEEIRRQGKRGIFWGCLCSCGNRGLVGTHFLVSGKSRGCGSCKNRLRPYESLFNSLSKSAKRRSISMDFSYEEFLEFTLIKACHYCGISVNWTEYGLCKNGGAHNLDRKDNNIGYTKNNLAVCCYRCNSAKMNHFSYEEWVRIGNLIRSMREEA